MISHLGDEYPVAVTLNGVRMPLISESRWLRNYTNTDAKTGYQISRFMDGSAALTFPEFAREWPTWSTREQQDFCNACSWLGEQDDFAVMLRHLMRHGDPQHWYAIACTVGSRLPQDEAFELLTHALQFAPLEEACNISQGLSITRHPEAERVLRAHFATLWSHPSLWDDDSFLNRIAYGATCCLKHLLDLGVAPEVFTDQVQAFAQHPCTGNRDSCHRSLAKHFPWLNESATCQLAV